MQLFCPEHRAAIRGYIIVFFPKAKEGIYFTGCGRGGILVCAVRDFNFVLMSYVEGMAEKYVRLVVSI